MRTDHALYIASYLMDLCAGLLVFTLPLVALDLGASTVELGLIGTVGSMAYILACSFTGKLADRWDRRRLMAAASLGAACVYGLLMVVRHVGLLILGYALSSVMMALFWPALQAVLAEGRNRAQLVRVLGNFNMIWTAGFLVGPLLGGPLYEMDPRLPFVVSTTSALIITVGMLLVRFTPVADPSEAGPDLPDPAHLKKTSRFRTIAWIASFTAFFAIGMLNNQFPRLAQELAFSPSLLGVMLALPRVVQFAVFMTARYTHHWQYRLYPHLVPQAGAIAGMLILVTQEAPAVLGIAFGAVGLLTGASFSTSQFYALFQEEKKGESGAVNEIMVGLGNVSGPLIGGILALAFGLRAPYMLCVGVLCAGMILEYRLARKT
jgi:MFS family permease